MQSSQYIHVQLSHIMRKPLLYNYLSNAGIDQPVYLQILIFVLFTYLIFVLLTLRYRNDPKFLDEQVWANSADPGQTAPRRAV